LSESGFRSEQLTLVCIGRYYEKSIIEQEIEEQRKGPNQPSWAETKRSLREARYRLSQSIDNGLNSSAAKTPAATTGTTSNGSGGRGGGISFLFGKESVCMEKLRP
jgi:hypothetical protein